MLALFLTHNYSMAQYVFMRAVIRRISSMIHLLEIILAELAFGFGNI